MERLGMGGHSLMDLLWLLVVILVILLILYVVRRL